MAPTMTRRDYTLSRRGRRWLFTPDAWKTLRAARWSATMLTIAVDLAGCLKAGEANHVTVGEGLTVVVVREGRTVRVSALPCRSTRRRRKIGPLEASAAFSITRPGQDQVNAQERPQEAPRGRRRRVGRKAWPDLGYTSDNALLAEVGDKEGKP